MRLIRKLAGLLLRFEFVRMILMRISSIVFSTLLKRKDGERIILKHFSDRYLHFFSDLMMNFREKQLSLKLLELIGSRDNENWILRESLGIKQFLCGEYKKAAATFSLTDRLKKAKLNIISNQKPVAFFDNSWVIAIGHMTYFDIYLKAEILGHIVKKSKVIIKEIDYSDSLLSGWSLLEYLGEYNIQVTDHNTAMEMYKLKSHEIQLHQASFWYSSYDDGNVDWFAPYGARIDEEWNAAGYGPLFTISDEEKQRFRKYAEKAYGLPEDAWYVTLHARDAGFHQAWHNKYPGTRNAEIETYNEAIDWIIEQGGWVIRMGDRSMPPLDPRPNLIDYASNTNKSQPDEILLFALCEYLIGTNSGISLVPPMFGVRSLLTNWSPIAIPNWYSKDFIYPKIIIREKTGESLGLEEQFSTSAGWSQFKNDLEEEGLTVVDNTPSEILSAVKDFHRHVFDGEDLPVKTIRAQNNYEKATKKLGGYGGAKISPTFLKNNPEFLKS